MKGSYRSGETKIGLPIVYGLPSCDETIADTAASVYISITHSVSNKTTKFIRSASVNFSKHFYEVTPEVKNATIGSISIVFPAIMKI